MKTKINLLLILSSLTFVSCGTNKLTKVGNGKVAEKVYTVGDATGLSISNIFIEKESKKSRVKVKIEKGEQKIVIKTDKNVLDSFRLSIDEKSHSLVIDSIDKNAYCVDNIEIGIYGYKFDTINLSDCSTNINDNCFSSENLSLTSYASDITFNEIKTSNVSFKSRGASNIKVNTLEALIFKGENYEAGVLNVGDIDVSNGEISLYAGSHGTFNKAKFNDLTLRESSSSNANFENIEISRKGKFEVSDSSKITLKGTSNVTILDVSNASICDGIDFGIKSGSNIKSIENSRVDIRIDGNDVSAVVNSFSQLNYKGTVITSSRTSSDSVIRQIDNI